MFMVKPQQLGTNVRMSFSKIYEALEMPNLIDVQKKIISGISGSGHGGGAAGRFPHYGLFR